MNSLSVPTFEELYQQYQSPIYRRLAFLAGPEQAEDLLQETFVHAWRAYPPPTADNLSSWLYQIANRVAINAHRKRQAEQRKLTKLARYAAHTIVVDENSTIEQQVQLQALASLTSRQREVLSAFAYGYTYQELATRFSLTRAQLTHVLRTARLAARQEYRRATMERSGMKRLNQSF